MSDYAILGVDCLDCTYLLCLVYIAFMDIFTPIKMEMANIDTIVDISI